jgi:hypothetical protein
MHACMQYTFRWGVMTLTHIPKAMHIHIHTPTYIYSYRGLWPRFIPQELIACTYVHILRSRIHTQVEDYDLDWYPRSDAHTYTYTYVHVWIFISRIMTSTHTTYIHIHIHTLPNILLRLRLIPQESCPYIHIHIPTLTHTFSGRGLWLRLIPQELCTRKICTKLNLHWYDTIMKPFFCTHTCCLRSMHVLWCHIPWRLDTWVLCLFTLTIMAKVMVIVTKTLPQSLIWNVLSLEISRNMLCICSRSRSRLFLFH